MIVIFLVARIQRLFNQFLDTSKKLINTAQVITQEENEVIVYRVPSVPLDS